MSHDQDGLPPFAVEFPDAGQGSSCLIRPRADKNDWIVVDSHRKPPELSRDRSVIGRNQTLARLAGASNQSGFRIHSVVLSHFDFDHYSGLVDILKRFAGPLDQPAGLPRLAWDPKADARSVVSWLVLPAEYVELIKDYLGWKSANACGATGQIPGMRSIKRSKVLCELLDYAIAFDAAGRVAYLDQFKKVWSERVEATAAHGVRRSADYWLACYGPSADITIRRSIRDEFAYHLGGMTPPHKRARKNASSYVLGFGCGTRLEDPHILLTGDVNPPSLQRIQDGMRRVILEFVCRRPAREWSLPIAPDCRLFIRRTASEDEAGGLTLTARVAPVTVFSIPHHGASSSALTPGQLDFWLSERSPSFPSAPKVAIVQGFGRDLIGPVAPLLGRGVRVFASHEPTASPKRRQARVGRLSRRLGPKEARPVLAEEGRSMTFRGGPSGMESIVADGFFELHPTGGGPLMSVQMSRNTTIYSVLGGAQR